MGAAIFALAGCQATPPTSLVQNLPPPNFDGPGDLTAPPPAPPPVHPAPPVAVAPRLPDPASATSYVFA